MVTARSLPKPNPQPMVRSLFEEEVEQYRRLDCRFVNNCLKEIMDGGRGQFATTVCGLSCNSCEAFEPMSADQRESDRDALLELTAAMVSARTHVGPSGSRRRESMSPEQKRLRRAEEQRERRVRQKAAPVTKPMRRASTRPIVTLEQRKWRSDEDFRRRRIEQMAARRDRLKREAAVRLADGDWDWSRAVSVGREPPPLAWIMSEADLAWVGRWCRAQATARCRECEQSILWTVCYRGGKPQWVPTEPTSIDWGNVLFVPKVGKPRFETRRGHVAHRCGVKTAAER